MGQDQVVTPEKLNEMVRQGELGYIYWDAPGRGFRQLSDISWWVTPSRCEVPGIDTATPNSGAPDGTSQVQGGSQAG